MKYDASCSAQCSEGSTHTHAADGSVRRADEDRGKCPDCGKVSDRVLRRLNLIGAPRLCDECHEERSKR
jgi:hypothetical protein